MAYTTSSYSTGTSHPSHTYASPSYPSPPSQAQVAPPAPQHPSSQSQFSNLTLDNTLEDLSARFIVNLPEEELESVDRVCFQIEQAHWYYEDFVRPTAANPQLLPSFGLKHFSLLMFKSCPLLHDLVPNHANIWTSFMAYKERVPVCGAILISQDWDKVLLVKGWQKGASWSFPRGKINKEETEGMCAVREVLEETGFDLLPIFPPHQLLYPFEEPEGSERRPYYIEIVIKEQRIRLYFVPNVAEDTVFETRTRKEISKIDWFSLKDLPTWGKNKKKQEEEGGRKAKFYMVTPFISHLKLWIDRNRPKNVKQKQGRKQAQAPQTMDWPPAPLPRDQHRAVQSESDEFSTADEQSTEDEERETSFSTTEAGSQALQALFFGGGELSTPRQVVHKQKSKPARRQDTYQERSALPPSEDHFYSTPPAVYTPPQDLLPPPSLETLSLQSHGGGQTSLTPPQKYERQSEFIQPRPKPTQVQTTRLLEMLNDSDPKPSPPPGKHPNGPSLLSPVELASAGQYAQFSQGENQPSTQAGPEGINLLSILRGDKQPPPPQQQQQLYPQQQPQPQFSSPGQHFAPPPHHHQQFHPFPGQISPGLAYALPPGNAPPNQTYGGGPMGYPGQGIPHGFGPPPAGYAHGFPGQQFAPPQFPPHQQPQHLQQFQPPQAQGQQPLPQQQQNLLAALSSPPQQNRPLPLPQAQQQQNLLAAFGAAQQQVQAPMMQVREGQMGQLLGLFNAR